MLALNVLALDVRTSVLSCETSMLPCGDTWLFLPPHSHEETKAVHRRCCVLHKRVASNSMSGSAAVQDMGLLPAYAGLIMQTLCKHNGIHCRQHCSTCKVSSSALLRSTSWPAKQQPCPLGNSMRAWAASLFSQEMDRTCCTPRQVFGRGNAGLHPPARQ